MPPAAPDPQRLPRASRCRDCRIRLPAGAAAWLLRGPGSTAATAALCGPCARPLVRGEAGRSADRVAAELAHGDRADAPAPRRRSWAWVMTFGAGLLVGGQLLATSGTSGLPVGMALVWAGGTLGGAGALGTWLRPLTRGRSRAALPPDRRWALGAAGERDCAQAIDASGLPAIHDRAVPGSNANLDHVVVTPGAVYVIDAKNWSGRIHTRPGHLGVSGQDRTGALTGAHRQADLVRAALEQAGARPPVVPVVCFTGAAQPAGTPTVGGVVLVGVSDLPRWLRDHAGRRAPDERTLAVLDVLAWTFPPA